MLVLGLAVVVAVGEISHHVALHAHVQALDGVQQAWHPARRVKARVKLAVQFAPGQRIALVLHDGDQPLQAHQVRRGEVGYSVTQRQRLQRDAHGVDFCHFRRGERSNSCPPMRD